MRYADDWCLMVNDTKAAGQALRLREELYGWPASALEDALVLDEMTHRDVNRIDR